MDVDVHAYGVMITEHSHARRILVLCTGRSATIMTGMVTHCRRIDE